jgi:hypothetical protein
VNVDWRHVAGEPDEGSPDPAFPARRVLLDPYAVAEALPGRAFGGWPAGAPSELLNVYYYPGRTLQAVHRLPNGAVVTLHGVPVGAARPRAGRPVQLPGARAVAVPFPLDADLPALREVSGQLGPAADLLSYLPGRRAVLATADRVAKVAAPSDVRRAHRRQCALWSAPDRGFRMAEPLTLDDGVRWERRVAGVGLQSRLGDLSTAELAGLLGTQLAALHGLGRPPALEADLPGRGAAELLHRLEHKTLRTVGRALPALSARAAAVVATLRALGPPVTGPQVVVHGDLHIANLVLDERGLVLLDLDDVGRGDPELDLALFGSRLLLVALHRGEGLDHAAAVVAELPAAYHAQGGRAVSPRAFAWYLAGCLVGRQVKTSVRHLAPDLDRLAADLLRLAEEVLARGRCDAATVAGAA